MHGNHGIIFNSELAGYLLVVQSLSKLTALFLFFCYKYLCKFSSAVVALAIAAAAVVVSIFFYCRCFPCIFKYNCECFSGISFEVEEFALLRFNRI